MDYVYTISCEFPNVFISCVGDPEVYTNIVWESGDVLPTEAALQTAYVVAVKKQMWNKIKIERDRRKSSGVHVGEKWFHSDDTSRIQQIGLVMFGANLPANLQWKTLDGSFVTMTQTLAGQIFSTTAYSDQAIFSKAEYHKAQMEASSAPQAYNYLTGWPTAYGE